MKWLNRLKNTNPTKPNHAVYLSIAAHGLFFIILFFLINSNLIIIQYSSIFYINLPTIRRTQGSCLWSLTNSIATSALWRERLRHRTLTISVTG